MAMDAVDYAAVIGFALFAIAARTAGLEGALAAAVLGGFALSLSTWRLYAGRAWEALGWLAWVAAAVLLALGTAGNAFASLGFLLSLVLGVGLLFAGRFDLLPDVWSADRDPDSLE